jgi:hypothetical protein
VIKLYETFPSLVDLAMVKMLAPADEVIASATANRKS